MKLHCSLLTLLIIIICTTGFSQYHVVPQTGHNDMVLALEYSPDGNYLASAGHDKIVLLWDTKTNLHYPLYGHAVGVSTLAFSPDNKYLVSGDFSGNVIVWDVATHQIVNRITNNSDEHSFHKIQFINNDELAMVNDKLFQFWNCKTNIVTKKIPLKATYFALHPKSPTLLLLEQRSNLSTTNGFTTTNKMVLYDYKKFTPLEDYWIRSIGSKWQFGEFSSSGKYLALIGDGKLALLDFQDKKLMWQIKLPINPQKIRISDDESKIIFAGDREHPDLFVYDRATGKQLQHNAVFTDFSFAYNHQLQIVAGAHNQQQNADKAVECPINIYDLKSQVIIKRYPFSNYNLQDLAWDEKNKKLYVVSTETTWTWDMEMGAINSAARRYDVPLPERSHLTQRISNGSEIYYLSPYKKYRAQTQGSGEVVVTDNSTGAKILTTPVSNTFGLTFSADNKRLYRSTADDLFVYDLATGTQAKQKHYDKASISKLSASPNGKYLAIGKIQNEYGSAEKFYIADYSIDIVDPVTLQVIHTLIGHQGNVTAVEFTADNKYLISASFDGSVRIWDPVTGKQKFELYGYSETQYFIAADNGYYSSSKSGIARIAFEYKNTIVPGKLFETQMNRPDKVAEAMGYSNPVIVAALKKAFEKRIAQLGIQEEQLKLEALPQLSANGLPAPSVNTKSIQISYQALDNLNELHHIALSVNSVPVYGRKGLPVKGKTAKGKLEVELTEGRNKVEISVVNAKGLSSVPVTFDVFCTVKTQPDLYLITIGVDEFLDKDYNLNYAGKDAADIAALFASKKSAYRNFIHLPFSGMKATRQNILAVKDDLQKTRPDDQVIIFVATHGLLDEKFNYYLATYNMIFDNPAFQGLAYNDLEGILDGIPARKKLILLDACHSGEVDAAEVTASSEAVKSNPNIKVRGFKPVKKTSNVAYENTFDLMKNLFADLREGTGTTVISSAGGVEFAIESAEWSNGAFTAAILEGIKTKRADADGDAQIGVEELKRYVFERVIEMTHGKQHPTSRIDNIDNDFTFVSTIAGSGSYKVIDFVGYWEPYEWDANMDGKYEPITGTLTFDKIQITKGADGFFYAFGSNKLKPEGNNEYSGPGLYLKVEHENSIIRTDDTHIRFRKIK
ncbi:MAG TPA: caspase family protein [Ohtaekwangia sp.]|nr:caspase family protein [Ohtaekwangia sp.]